MIVKLCLPRNTWEDLKSYRDENILEKIIRAHFFARTEEFIYDYHNLLREVRAYHRLYYQYCHLPYSLIVDIEEVLAMNDCFIGFEEVEYLMSYIIMIVLAESVEAKRYCLYFNYAESDKLRPDGAIYDPALYTCIRIGLPRNVWRGIANLAVEPEDDINEALEIVCGSNFFSRYDDIINDYKNGIMQKTFNQLGTLYYRGIFLASGLVRDMRFKLDNDAPQLSIGDALSYLLIKILQEGLIQQADRAEE